MKKKTLQEHSENYRTNIKPYEEFKKAEDAKGEVISILKSKGRNKSILDIGCGEGSDAKRLAPTAKKYYALDSSKGQLNEAKLHCTGINTIEFLHSSGEDIELPDNSVDLVICAWSISVIKGYKRRSKTIREAERIVRPGGEILLIENDWQGEFEDIRRHPMRTKKYNEWLIKQGFVVWRKINTYFKFPSVTLAKEIFHQIWGSRVSNKINSEKIEHKIIVFSRIKAP